MVNFTDQGIRHVKQTTERARQLANTAAKFGVKMKDVYWTMGPFDAIFTAESPDDETMAALSASVASLGNIRTQTLRAFSADEMNGILKKIP